MRNVAFIAGMVLAAVAAVRTRSALGAAGDARESVVRVQVTRRLPDLVRPWTKRSPENASGSGVVIDGRRILTNAHVVLYASQIAVQPYESPDKLGASVEAIAPEIDLAILKLENATFFDSHPPLPRASQLPEVKDSVLVYGYPTGGTSLSITKGIVSRIDLAPYYYGGLGLRIQVDAALNPGNSGGAAVVDEQMVGLVFSKLQEAENIGYLIPNEEIETFLQDMADGRYGGKPRLFDQRQTLENDALRAKLGVGKAVTGVVVRGTHRIDNYPVRAWDVITRIGEHDIDNTGMVQVKPNLRLAFDYLVPSLTRDGSVPLTIVRDGKEMQIPLPVSSEANLLMRFLKGRYPSYFVYGPLVFSPVTADFITGADKLGANWFQLMSFRSSPLLSRRNDRQAFEGEELVMVASRMFPHRIGQGYDDPFGQVVSRVNGVSIRNFRHFVETIRDLKDRYMVIEFADKNVEALVFDHEEVLRVTDEILEDNGIREPCSEDVLGVFQRGRAPKGGR